MAPGRWLGGGTGQVTGFYSSALSACTFQWRSISTDLESPFPVYIRVRNIIINQMETSSSFSKIFIEI